MEEKKSRVSVSDKEHSSRRSGPRQSTGFDQRRISMGSSRHTSRMSNRRNTFGFGSVPFLRNETFSAQHRADFRRPTKQYLNTYQLDPRRPFHVARSEEIINEILDELFDKHVYNLQESPLLAARISSEIIHRAKAEQFDRYRLIAVTSLGQRRMQSYNNAVMFLWDHLRDSYVNVNRELHTVFIQVTLFGIYLD